MATIEKKKKNYVKGSAKEVTFANGGSVIHLDIKVDDLQRLPVNEAGYVKLTLSKLPGVDNYGNTHSLYENDFVPTKQADRVAPGQKIQSFNAARVKDDMPF